jgi:hypothetical protein
VARLGGDEFVVLIQNLSIDAADARLHATTVGHKILSSLNEPYRLQEHTHTRSPPALARPFFWGIVSRPPTCSNRLTWPCTKPKPRAATPYVFIQNRPLAPENIAKIAIKIIATYTLTNCHLHPTMLHFLPSPRLVPSPRC